MPRKKKIDAPVEEPEEIEETPDVPAQEVEELVEVEDITASVTYWMCGRCDALMTKEPINSCSVCGGALKVEEQWQHFHDELITVMKIPMKPRM